MTAKYRISLWALLPAAGLAACAQAPMGPTVQVLPGARKSFEAFQLDAATCQQYSQGQVAGQAETANNRAIGGAVLGTVLGAGLGAAVGGGRGAGIGAASGAGLGTAAGAGYSADAQGGIQAQYDNSYSQCMYSKGNRVAGLPDPEPEQRVVQRRRVPVRQVARAPAAGADWVAPTAATQGGVKAPAASGWVQPVQGE
jgi:outer membrane lipoprotein SlyB